MINAAKWAIGINKKKAPAEDEMGPPMRQAYQMQVPNPKRGEPIESTVYPLSPVAKPKPIKRLPGSLKPKKTCRTCPKFIKKKAKVKGEWK